MLDKQQNTVYKWERAKVAPLDTTQIGLKTIQSIVNYVWQGEGLDFPPLVQELREPSRSVIAVGSRTAVAFRLPTYTWVILHELAHALTSNHQGYNNGHGGLFMGAYLDLVKKHLNFDLIDSAKMAGLVVCEPERAFVC